MRSWHGFAIVVSIERGSVASMGDPHERVLDFSMPSHVYRTCDVRGMRKLAEVVEEHIRGVIRYFLRRHESEGVMVQFEWPRPPHGCTS